MLLLLSIPISGNAQQKQFFIGAGIDYRQDPIDIENVPRGPSLTENYGYLTHINFWKVLSIHARTGFQAKHNWAFSLALYARYNGNHYTEDPYVQSGGSVAAFNEHAPSVSKARFDIFIDTEKKFRVRRGQEKFVFVMTGLGLTNINSGVNLSYRSNFSGALIRYKGSYLHFGPRICMGYQYKAIKVSLEAYLTEDALKTNISSLWTGASISYMFDFKKRKK